MVFFYLNILLCHTNPLYVLLHYIHVPPLKSLSFPPAWQPHVSLTQHS